MTLPPDPPVPEESAAERRAGTRAGTGAATATEAATEAGAPAPAALAAGGPIVFLHIPKTAGQTIHNELARLVGPAQVSPVRVHTQVSGDAPQMPPGFRLYSGHLDWTGIDGLPADRFVFTVLRDPYERIASFYFYLLEQAEQLSPEELETRERTGLRTISRHSADDYFFGGERPWKTFIHDHYDNFYTTYLATRKMRGWREVAKLPPHEKMARALAGAAAIDRIYATTDLTALEADVAARFGAPISVVGRYVNAGPQGGGQRRWPALLERFERDESARKLARFGALDEQLMETLGLATEALSGDEGDD